MHAHILWFSLVPCTKTTGLLSFLQSAGRGSTSFFSLQFTHQRTQGSSGTVEFPTVGVLRTTLTGQFSMSAYHFLSWGWPWSKTPSTYSLVQVYLGRCRTFSERTEGIYCSEMKLKSNGQSCPQRRGRSPACLLGSDFTSLRIPASFLQGHGGN